MEDSRKVVKASQLLLNHPSTSNSKKKTCRDGDFLNIKDTYALVRSNYKLLTRRPCTEAIGININISHHMVL